MQPRDVVVGAGIAGASVARALAVRGRPVVVLDPGGPAAGASGVPRAVVQPITGMRAPWRPLYADARDRAERWLTDHVSPDLWHRRGILRVALDERHAALWERQMANAPDHVARWLAPREARQRATGISAGTTGGIWIPGGIDLDGAAVVRSLLDAPGITVRRTHVTSIEADRTSWSVHTTDGETCARSVTVAAGMGAADLLPGLKVPMQPIRGVCGWREASIASRVVVGHRGQIIPMGVRTFVGSTFSPGEAAPRIEPSDVNTLAERLGQAIPDAFGPIINPWVGVRVAARDRAPIVAADPARPGVFAVAGLGSKGFLLAPWIAERVADAIVDGTDPDVPAEWRWR